MERNSLAIDTLSYVLRSAEKNNSDPSFKTPFLQNRAGSVTLSELMDIVNMRKSSRMTGSKKINYSSKKDVTESGKTVEKLAGMNSAKETHPRAALEKDESVLTDSKDGGGGGRKRKRKLTKDRSEEQPVPEMERSPSSEPKKKRHQKDLLDTRKTTSVSSEPRRTRQQKESQNTSKTPTIRNEPKITRQQKDMAKTPSISSEPRKTRQHKDSIDTGKALAISSEPRRTRQQKDLLDTSIKLSPSISEARSRRSQNDSVLVSPLKKIQKNYLKVCPNCGTTAINSKAKKCHNCKKFFYPHWAKRCRIPPCPKCHYSRKARGCTMLPKNCERCGSSLPVCNIVEEGGDNASECSSVWSGESELLDEVDSNKSESCTSSLSGEQTSLLPIKLSLVDESECVVAHNRHSPHVSNDAESTKNISLVIDSSSGTTDPCISAITQATENPPLVTQTTETSEISTPVTQTTESPPPVAQTTESPPPVAQTTESPPPVTQITESPPPVAQTTESPPPVAQTTESPPPVTQTTESPPPVTQITESPPPVAQTTESPPPVAQTTESPPPVTQITESPPPVAQTTESPPPVTQITESPPPVAQTTESPPPVAQTTESPPPVTQTTESPPPVTQITESPPPVAQTTESPPPVAQTTESHPPPAPPAQTTESPPPLAQTTESPPPLAQTTVSPLPPAQTIESPLPPAQTTESPPPPAQTTESPPPPAQTTVSPPPPAQTTESPPPPAQTTVSPPPPAQTTESPPPLAQTTESPPPLAQTTESPPPLAQTTESPPPLAQTTESPPPPAQTAESPPPPAQTTESPPPPAQTTESPPPLAQTTESPPPLAQTTESPPPPAQTTESPPPPAQTTESPPPPAQTTESPPPPAQTTESPPPLAPTTESPPPLAQTTESPPPLAQTTESPPPLAQTIENPPPVTRIAEGPPPVTQTTESLLHTSESLCTSRSLSRTIVPITPMPATSQLSTEIPITMQPAGTPVTVDTQPEKTPIMVDTQSEEETPMLMTTQSTVTPIVVAKQTVVTTQPPKLVTSQSTVTPIVVAKQPAEMVTIHPEETPMAVTAQPTETPMAVTAQPTETPMVVTTQPTETPMAVTAQPTETPMAVTAQPTETPMVVTTQPTETPMQVTVEHTGENPQSSTHGTHTIESPLPVTSLQSTKSPLPPLLSLVDDDGPFKVLPVFIVNANASRKSDTQTLVSKAGTVRMRLESSDDASIKTKHLRDVAEPASTSHTFISSSLDQQNQDPSEYSSNDPVVVSSYSLDILPQISDIMSNIDNATTVITSSCPKLTKSLEEQPENNKRMDKEKYEHFYSKLGDHTSDPSLDPEVDKEKRDASIEPAAEEPGQNLNSNGRRVIPIAPKLSQLPGIPGFESLLSMPISQIINQVNMSNHLNRSTIQSLLMPNRPETTPISLTGNQDATAHVQPQLSTSLASELSNDTTSLLSYISRQSAMATRFFEPQLVSPPPEGIQVSGVLSPQLLGQQQTIANAATVKDMMAMVELAKISATSGEPTRFSSGANSTSMSQLNASKSTMTSPLDYGRISSLKAPPPPPSGLARNNPTPHSVIVSSTANVGYPLTCPPPLKRIPERTEDNSVIRCSSDKKKVPLPPDSFTSSWKMKRQNSTELKSSYSGGAAVGSSAGCIPDSGYSNSVASGMSDYAWSVRDTSSAVSSIRPISVPLGTVSISLPPPPPPPMKSVSNSVFPNPQTLAAAKQDLLSIARSQGSAPITTGTTTPSGDGGGGGGCTDSGSDSGGGGTSFQKLELLGQSSNIRISILKQKSDPMKNNVISLPSISTEAKCPGPLATVAAAITTQPTSLGGKFQNFAVSPSLSVIATVETQQSTGAAGRGNISSGCTFNSRSSIESRYAQTASNLSTPRASSVVYNPKASNSSSVSNSNSWSNVGTSIAYSNVCFDNPAVSNVSSQASNCSPSLSSEITSLPIPSQSLSSVGEFETGMDPGAIEKLASKVQMRIKDALSMSGPSLEETEPTSVTAEMKSIPGPPLSKAGSSFRRILPNLTKPTAHSSATSPTSFSHARTPGVVTVQVCSSIPSNLTLSSINNSTNPSTSNQEGGSGNASSSEQGKSQFPGIMMPRGVVAGGGNVMVTPLSPSMLPAGRTVAQIVTSKSAVDTVPSKTKIPAQMRHGDDTTDTAGGSGRNGCGRKLYSEESLNSSLESSGHATSEAGSTKSKKKTGGSGKGHVHQSNGEEDGEGGEEEDEDEGEEEGEDRKGGDEGSKDKRKRKGSHSGGGKKKKANDMLLYTVKLKDCYMHHLMWNEHRVVLIVPTAVAKSDINTRSKCMGEGSSSGLGSGDNSAMTNNDRKRRRKPKIETLQEADEELEEFVENSPSHHTPSSHIRSPCFSLYELRLKHFSHLAGNSVYIHTHKNNIKTQKTPTHWMPVLRRMGGVQEHGQTCRLLDIKNVKEMCQHFDLVSSIPSNLDALCRNDFPKTRILIDLSQFSPDQLLEPDRLDVIPSCPCVEEPPVTIETEVKKTKRKYTKRKPVEEKEPPRKKRKYVIKSEENYRKARQKYKLNDQSRDQFSKERTHSYSKSPDRSRDPSQTHLSPYNKSNDMDMDYEWSDEERRGDVREQPPSKRPPPPLIKHNLLSSSDPPKVKKKVCPQCDSPITRKCKKCPFCGKRFGVFTFGRKLCPACGRINLARMSNCFQCDHPLANAAEAVPKLFDKPCPPAAAARNKPGSTRMGSVFGARKKRKTPFFVSHGESDIYKRYDYPTSTSTKGGGSSKKMQMKHNNFPQLPDSVAAPTPPIPSQSSRHTSLTENDSLEGADVFQDDSRDGEDPTQLSNEEEPEDMKPPGKIARHTGYQYGRVPWSDADITCLVDEKGVAKFCLQELCSKVIHNHAKGDVFAVVTNLHLPVEHGDTALLRKLQALGLHSNRSPICRLIASEELWTLLDALQEPVPEEVYQHLEHISSSSTPLLSPHITEVGGGGEGGEGEGGGGRERDSRGGSEGGEGDEGGGGGGGGVTNIPSSSGLQSPAGLVPSRASALVEEDEHGFVSTLHEVECSDGQSVSILRAFNGEQYACVTEFWRKYFPEVNRNHLTSALKRLGLDTIVPTGQQATLLRSAGVISLRGAAGRLMKFEHMEKLMDDFGIPLQIGKPTDKSRIPSHSASISTPTACDAPTFTLPKLSVRRPTMRGYKSMSNHLTSPRQIPLALPPGKILMSKEDAIYASCMRNVVAGIDLNDLRALLVKSRESVLNSRSGLETASSVCVDSEIDNIQQLIYSRRLLCNVLTDEIGYLTVSNHGYMAESVRMDRTERQVLRDVQGLINNFDVTLNS